MQFFALYCDRKWSTKTDSGNGASGHHSHAHRPTTVRHNAAHAAMHKSTTDYKLLHFTVYEQFARFRHRTLHTYINLLVLPIVCMNAKKIFDGVFGVGARCLSGRRRDSCRCMKVESASIHSRCCIWINGYMQKRVYRFGGKTPFRIS